jgi:hypothetical protein
MKQNFFVFLIVSFGSLMTGNLISQPTFGQLDELAVDLGQQNKEKFLELGEEHFRNDCYENNNSEDNEFTKDLMSELPHDIAKKLCEGKINGIKNETGTLQQNQTLDSVTGETSYTTHYNYSNSFTVDYPTDWHLSHDGKKIFKETREFKMSKYDDPIYSVLDTISFGSIFFDNKKDEDGVKITDNLAQLFIGHEPALTFTYSKLGKEFMVVALMHNNVGYVFEYGTLKENFDKDFDTMMQFIGTLRLS